MVLKLKNSANNIPAESKKEHGNSCHKKRFSKVEALYVALMCFTTHCLSCIALEAGGRASFGNPGTKSAAFNALFRRTYNLKIIILVTHVIAGLITTLMMTLADRYGIPYLYLPWLVNTMRGMALYEGPALLNLADVLLPNVTVPTATFTIITFFLYVEEFFIWNEVLKKFLNCWKEYHKQNKCAAEKGKVKPAAMQKRKGLHCQAGAENNINSGIEKLKSEQKPKEFYGKCSGRISTDVRVRSVKSSTGDNSNLVRNRLLDMTG